MILLIKLFHKQKDMDFPIVKRIKEISDKSNIRITQVNIAWLLSKKFIVSSVVGCSKIRQLEDLVKDIKVKINDEDIKYLEELYKLHWQFGPLK